VPADDAFARLLDDLLAHGRPENIQGIVSGYFASPAQVAAAAELVKTVKAARPDALYICDPVIGDSGALYVERAIAEAIRDRLVPLADGATPNLFECAWLTGGPAAPQPDLAALALNARDLPTAVALITSAPAMMRGQIGTLLVSEGDTLLFEHPYVSSTAKGTGDVLAALLLARRLQGQAWAEATRQSLASVFEIVAQTAKAGADELMLVSLQNALVAPRARINVRSLR
jgi:pyridoxine kinase